MKVILLEDVDNLGEEGTIVSVKDGYGRNFLIPKRLARLATKNTVKAWEEERRQASRKLSKRKEDATALAAEIAKVEVVLQAKVGEENRIFGSITAQQIADGLAAHGVTADRRKIEIQDEIKVLGVYTASVKVHPEVVAQVKVRVEAETA
ncbi:MAG: 50S ribosomal protein L9 [Bacteroidetes Order II. Incertae sedis bacterium]|jgi:large subunit ribosomal protein L9|nr:50S ribosomal protein L9 [Bacteroidetes Order II. bacterium]MDG1754450.1 50S ribosomal protein L9 [Rhodothermales bacterium]HAY36726.1 50S ribosomal protein L9 [Bacteroidota bacterium]MBT4052028.1 50S ribosomal protein L9 [Bacteroidetes Order II. bacterium]MBT4602279.1 50S ribosomal protein L9 [Bacteroidetes Order II. bacterium]